jgi:hypothetical protein
MPARSTTRASSSPINGCSAGVGLGVAPAAFLGFSVAVAHGSVPRRVSTQTETTF